MQKKKKLFNYETEIVNVKELEEDIKQAEQLIAKLKGKVDPKAEKLKRRSERLLYLFDSLFLLIVVLCVICGFVFGHTFGVKEVENLYNYSVSTGIITPTE